MGYVEDEDFLAVFIELDDGGVPEFINYLSGLLLYELVHQENFIKEIATIMKSPKSTSELIDALLSGNTTLGFAVSFIYHYFRITSKEKPSVQECLEKIDGASIQKS